MTFVDTNILVHAVSTFSPDHARAKAALAALNPQEAALSRQVLREYVSVVTRPQQWAVPMSLEAAMNDARGFSMAFALFEDGEQVWFRLHQLSQTHSFAGKQVHDANLVATMLAHRASRLLTFNAKHFRRFAPLIEIIEP